MLKKIWGMKNYAITYSVMTYSGQVIAEFNHEMTVLRARNETVAIGRLKSLIRKVFPDTMYVLIHDCTELKETRGKSG